MSTETLAVSRYSDNIYVFIDYEPLPHKPDIFKWRVKRWRPAKIGKLINRTPYDRQGNFKIGCVKEGELAFFIKNHVPNVCDETTCLVGSHYQGRAIRIYDTEYRAHDGALYEKKT